MEAPRGAVAKSRGAYYTERRVAEALCAWAVRGPHERVLDPSFGDGVFLEAASRRLEELERAGRGTGSRRAGPALCGVEVDAGAHGAVSRRLSSRAPLELVLCDFFELRPDRLARFHAVVGNPPFIRFQRYKGERRARALERAREAGVQLGPLASSWAPFVAHSSSFVAEGGRLGMVVPAELGHAPYARPLLAHLASSFARCTLVALERPLFPELDQSTLLLLAEDRGRPFESFELLALPGATALQGSWWEGERHPLDLDALVAGSAGLAHARLPAAARSVYETVASLGVPLGGLTHVESGYVTGANSHFHLTPALAEEAGLPAAALESAVFRTAALRGARFGREDWERASDGGLAGYLVLAEGHEDHPAVSAFLEEGVRAGVAQRSKARARRPWHRIPRVRRPPLLLGAMGDRRLPLAVNEAGAVAPNTFHAVVPRDGSLPGAALPRFLAVAWSSSLTELSVELEGHALGGGMLKLDPGEARTVVLPPYRALEPADLAEVDTALRSQGPEAARELADALVLRPAGVGSDEIELLRSATDLLRSLRRRR